jgi:hypothetical protein
MPSNDPFFTVGPEIKRLREVEHYQRPEEEAPEVTEEETEQLYEEVLELAEKAQKIADNAAKAAEKYYIPIGDDENEVRAAHRRAFDGDGKAITFAQYRSAIDGKKKAWSSLWEQDFKGYGEADIRQIDRRNIMQNLRDFEGPAGQDYFATLASFGSAALIIWGLNQLIGSQHAMDHQ